MIEPYACTQCGDFWGDHAFIATTSDPLKGGIILCPEPGCLCYSTWGVNGTQPELLPDEDELAELREMVRHQRVERGRG